MTSDMVIERLILDRRGSLGQRGDLAWPSAPSVTSDLALGSLDDTA